LERKVQPKNVLKGIVFFIYIIDITNSLLAIHYAVGDFFVTSTNQAKLLQKSQIKLITLYFFSSNKKIVNFLIYTVNNNKIVNFYD